MNAQATIQTIPLCALQLSPLNARKTGGDNVDDLIASIAADGLLQNLTVIAGKKGKFDVVAGGRRLRALQQLAKDKRIAADITVPCRVVDATIAMEASTAENTIREQMNPVDEIEAYGRLVEAGKSVTDIAVRFGQSERHVSGMLRLGTVSPKILADLRKDEIRLDQVKAFTITDDHDLQDKVWSELKGNQWGEDDPDDIRNALTERDIAADSKLARYITVAAYEAAGGAVRRDLFGDGVFLLDHLLADQLALEKLERRAAQLRKKGWAWVECRVDLPYGATQKLERLYNVKEEYRAYAGFFVTIDHDGKAKDEGPFIRPGDRQRAEQGQEIPETEAEAKAIQSPPKDTISAAQISRLKGVRTAIARNWLIGARRTMLTALAAALATDVFGDRILGDGVVKISPSHPNCNQDFAKGIEEQGGRRDLTADADAEAEHWEQTFSNMASALDIQHWLLDQPEDTTLDLLTYIAARSITLDDSTEDDAAFLQLADVDVRACWKATPEWLAAQGKATVLRIVRAVCDEETAQSLEKFKKGELAERAAALLANTGYLPEPLRPAGFTAPWVESAP